MYSLVLLPERNCTECTGAQKVLWGCTDEPKQPIEFDGEKLKRCPRRPMLDEGDKLNRVFWLYRNFDRGILPEEGGLLSQPHRLTQYFEVISLAKTVAEDEQRKTEQRRASAKARLQSNLG